MKRLSTLAAPALAGVVKADTPNGAIAEILNCYYAGADMIDLHVNKLDACDETALRKIAEASKLPILALNYSTIIDEETRVASLLRAVEAGVSGIDMQGYTFHKPSRTEFCGEDRYSFTKNSPREVVTDPGIIQKQCQLIEQVHSKGAEVLLSCHPGIFMNCEQVVELAQFLEQRNPDIIKIVTVARTEEDLPEIIKTMQTLKKEIKTPVSYHASGEAGMLSRILNPILGGQILFSVERYVADSTFEQLDLRTARTILDNIKMIYRRG